MQPGKLLQLITGLAVILASMLAAGSPAQADDDEPAGPQPLVVLIEFDPWRMVIGSDSPTFALYDDGLVIYRRETDEGEIDYVSVQLDEEELAALIEDLDIGDDFFALDDYYDIFLATDQPTSYLFAWNEEGETKAVGVYGAIRVMPEVREQVPEAFLSVFDKVIAFDHEDADAWLPEQIELIVWPYESSAEPLKWPAGWPGLKAPTTVEREMVYSIYLDASHYDELLALFDDLRAGEADGVLIDGRKWSISYRFPFPAEETWNAVLHGEDESAEPE